MKLSLFATRNDPIGLALLVAISVHAFIILGIGFDFFRPPPAVNQQTLEVTVVHKRQEPPPDTEKADFVAEFSQRGSGASEQRQRPSPLAQPTPAPPVEEPPAPQAPAAPAPLPPAEKAKRQVDTPPQLRKQQKRRPKEIVAVHKRRKPEALPLSEEAVPPPRVTASQILASTEAEIARLTNRIEQRSATFAKRPRRRAISASTKEFRYAAYLEAWRRKIERIGNLNYPEEARRKGLYGNLVLHVAVRADGSVEQVRVVRSSGHKLLDEAAMRIVRLAAPFAPFPENIRKETDILDITRTWQFLRGNRLGWGR